MKIGCCLSYSNTAELRKAKELGFDFMESAVISLIKASAGEVSEFAGFIRELGLPCPAANCLFPKESVRLTGPDADFVKAEDYLYSTLEHIKPIGIKTVVFGSGGSRRVPDGFSTEAATEQLIRFCSGVIAPAMKKFDMVCAIEELYKKSCNILNTCREVMDVVNAVGDPRVQLLVDLFHIGKENEPVETLVNYGGHIAHVHISSPINDGAFPRDGDGEDYKAFFDVLRKAGYSNNGLVSIEGHVIDGDFVKSSVDSLNCLRNL